VLCPWAGVAQASPGVQVTVQDSSGHSSGAVDLGIPWAALEAQLASEGHATWSLNQEKVDVYSADPSRTPLGSIDDFSVALDADVYVSLGFSVTAGSAATTFTITSGTVNANLENAVADASAGTVLTDPDGDGATLTGLYGNRAYRATYNGASSTFASLVDDSSVVDDTVTTSERYPASGRETIPGTVTDIQSAFHFTLSARDLAAGSSTFSLNNLIVPEPATLALLAFGGIFALAVRRRARA
jgi:hypothetical protein